MLGDARLSARPKLSVECAQRLREEVLAAVGHTHPDLELAVLVEPSEEHNLVERVHAVAAGLEMIRDLHNVMVEMERDGSLQPEHARQAPGHDDASTRRRWPPPTWSGGSGASSPACPAWKCNLEPLEPEVVSGQRT